MINVIYVCVTPAKLIAVCLAICLLLSMVPAHATSLQSPQEIEDVETRSKLQSLMSNEPAQLKDASRALQEVNKPESHQSRRGRNKGERRIVNGISTFRFEAAGALLYGEEKRTAKAWCSGTLVGCDKFLTAAHCIAKDPNPSNYFVFFQNAGLFQVGNVEWPREEYRFPYADLAVLTLARPVAGIAPLPLNRKISPVTGSTGTIVGFGRTGGDNEDYGIKRQGSITTAPCQKTYAGQHLVCWSFDAEVRSKAHAANTCNADSGGGLFMLDRDGRRSVQALVGVTSGGTKLDCMRGDHSYDTDLFQYQQWIEKAGEGRISAKACGSLPAWDVDRHVKGATARLSEKQPEVKFTLSVPPDLAVMRVAMNGEDNGEGRNDFDLYLISGEDGDISKAICAEDGPGQFGFCEIARPVGGIWTIVLSRKKGAGLAQLTVTMIPIVAPK